jgi:L-rhamnose isomerase
VWDYYCTSCPVPVGLAWHAAVRDYERRVLAGRSA